MIMANNKLKIQQFRTNDLIDDSGKQIEFGKDWIQNFFEIPDSEESATINLIFKSLSSDYEKLDGTSIELKLASITNRGDRKAYVNGGNGYSQLKYFFIHRLHLTNAANANDYFAIYKKSIDEYLLYFVPSNLYHNFLFLFQKDIPIVESSSHIIDVNSDDPYVKLLLMKKNLILTGAPGTGKTFLSKQIAAYVIGNCGWDSLTSEQKKQVGFVQFHPSYDYTDFVEGLRPAEGGEFCRQDGIFKDFCKRAISEDKSITDVSTNLFDKVYNELLDDIRGGAITKYERITADDLSVEVNSNGKIIFGSERKNYKTTSIRNLRLLFDHYIAEGKTNASGISREDMWKDIYDLTEGKTSTLDYTEYYWVLNQLLTRAKGARASISSEDKHINNERKKKPYIFIIDEINRGELSKIFGELFYSIEPDYRGPKGTVQTQYNNMVDEDDVFRDGFYVPENVYIIGTMNDVDRGVEAMDFAIRRRFGWKEVTAEESAENMGLSKDAKAKMKALNNALIEAGLTNAHKIGGAYFRKLEDNDYNSLWDYHLEGIIFEYFRGEPDALEKMLAIKKAYNEASLPEEDKTNSATTDDATPINTTESPIGE